jgi:hypothetical protein
MSVSALGDKLERKVARWNTKFQIPNVQYNFASLADLNIILLLEIQ